MVKMTFSEHFLKFACNFYFFFLIFVTFLLFTLFYMCYNNHSVKRTSDKLSSTPNQRRIEEAIVMLTLKAEKRNPEEKAKKLRRDGFITGVLYGKEMKENVSLKFTEKDAAAFIKNAKEGTQAYLELDGKNVDVLVKNIDFDPLTKKYMALDFQALVAGEVVSATVPIVYLNEDKVQGIFEAELSEVHYKADPAHLLEPIEIDLATLPQTTKTMYVKDLKLEEKGVHVTTSGEQQLFHIGAYGQEETDETEAEAADETK